MNRRIKTCILLLIPLISCGPDKSYLKQFADSLHTAKVCTDENYQALNADIDKGKIDNGIDVIRYCDHAAIIDARTYAPDIETSLEQILRDISHVYPGLDFSNFRKSIIVDSTISDDLTEFYDFRISLDVNGKTYEHTFFYRLMDTQTKNYTGGDQLDPEIIDIFNKVLSDQGALYRLRVVDEVNSNVKSRDRFGVIAVTYEQSKAIHRSGWEFFNLRYGQEKGWEE